MESQRILGAGLGFIRFQMENHSTKLSHRTRREKRGWSFDSAEKPYKCHPARVGNRFQIFPAHQADQHHSRLACGITRVIIMLHQLCIYYSLLLTIITTCIRVGFVLRVYLRHHRELRRIELACASNPCCTCNNSHLHTKRTYANVFVLLDSNRVVHSTHFVTR